MNTPRDNCNGAMIDGLLYVFGGRNSNTGQSTMKSLEIYDPIEQTWKFGASVSYLMVFVPIDLQMPTGRRSFATAVVKGKIVALGGERSSNQSGTFSEVEEYDPRTNLWTSLPPMPEGRHGVASTRLGNGIPCVHVL